MNHLILYLSVWCALLFELVLVVLQGYGLGQDISDFITTKIFIFQVGFTLIFPGTLQWILERGLFRGLLDIIKHAFMLAVYSTFHVLNISSFWQRYFSWMSY